MEHQLIIIDTYCQRTSIQQRFIHDLNGLGLITLVREDEVPCIQDTDIPKIEQLHRIHTDLNVNMEGLDIIYNMLNRMQNMQEEIRQLRQELEISNL